MTEPTVGDGSPADLPEVSTLPEGVRADVVEDGTTGWRNVPRAPASIVDTAPVEAAGAPAGPPPIPTVVKVVGALVVAALIGVATWLGLTLGRPEPLPSSTVTQMMWPLAPPVQVDTWVRGATETPSSINSDRQVTRAEYSNGTENVLLVLSRPETDLPTFLTNAGVTGAAAVADATCGTQTDSAREVCAQIVDETAVMVAGLDGQERSTLVGDLATFREALTALAGN